LIEAFVQHEYELLISCPYGEKLALMEHVSYQYDDPAIDRRGTNVVKDGKLLLHYLKLFRSFRPHIVLTYTAKPNVYGSMAAHLLGIPVINNVTGFGSVLNQKGLMQKFIMTLFKAAYRKSGCIMFQNETNMKLAEAAGLNGYEVFERVKALAPNQFFSLHQVGIEDSIPVNSHYTDYIRMGLDLTDGKIKDLCMARQMLEATEVENILNFVGRALYTILDIAAAIS
jgi:hypothetical protein